MSAEHPQRAAGLQLLAGATIIGTNGLMVRLAAMPPTAVAFWRMLLAVLVTLRHGWQPLPRTAWRWLAVPVLRNADKMSFGKIESEIKRLAGAVRDGKLGLQELSGGTFTITNGGVFGSLLSTPIINPPQSGILGMHSIQQRPIAVDGQVVIRPMMYIALSYDHRLVDGRESVTFLVRIKELLEDPSRLLLEV